MKDKDANRLAIEKAQIEVLIEKHRPHTPKTPDEVNRSGTAKNAKVDGQEGNKRKNPHTKKQQRISKLKHPAKKGKEAKNTEKGNTDMLLGDPLANTIKGTEKGQKDKMGKDDIGIFEFIFHGLLLYS